MKRKFKLFLTTLLVILSVFALFSCDDEEDDDSVEEIKTLNVFNWGEYISDGSLGSLDANAAFEEYFNKNLAKEYGFKIKVNYSTYPTNEDLYAKITSGAGNYDIVVPSDYMIEKLIEEDYLLPFDATTLPNYKYIKKDFKNLPYDEYNRYSVPYTYGMLGIIYNTALVDEEDYADRSWGLLWNEKYSGKILQFNNQRDAFATAMYYQNIDVNSTSEDDWMLAHAKLSEQKSLVQAYVNDEIFNKMITASASVAPYFAGDYLTMAAENDDLSFYYPTEGTNYFVDAMCITKSSKNPEVAKEYINFMLSEEVAIANALYLGYACPNELVTKSEVYKAGLAELHEDAYDILYGTSVKIANKNYSHSPIYRYIPKNDELCITLWESLKTENSTELWVHITCGAIVSAVVIFAGYSIYIKKKRSRDYRLRDKQKSKADK